MNVTESDGEGFIRLSFSPDRTRIVSVSEDDIVCMWNASSEKLVVALGYEADGISFSPNCGFVALSHYRSISKEKGVKAACFGRGDSSRANQRHYG